MTEKPTRKPRGRQELLELAGENHPNPDGSSRQNEIAKCLPGDKVTFANDPNYEYPDAILVKSSHGVGIGWIGKSDLEWFTSDLKAGFVSDAQINLIGGGVRERPIYGVWIKVALHGATLSPPKELTEAQKVYRRSRPSGGLLTGLFRVFSSKK